MIRLEALVLLVLAAELAMLCVLLHRKLLKSKEKP
jgi:hypothetical protein